MRAAIKVALVAPLLGACQHQQSEPESHYKSPDVTVEELGYYAVTPPSTAFGPGSLVTSIKGTGLKSPLKLTYLCSPKYINVPAPTVDTAASESASRALGGGVTLGAKTLADLGLGAEAQYVNSVTINFSNVKVEQLGFDEMQDVVDSLNSKCRNILAKYTAENLAFQTKQAIRADVKYEVSLKANASLEAKNIIVKFISANIGGNAEITEENVISGSGLYYGVVLHDIQS